MRRHGDGTNTAAPVPLNGVTDKNPCSSVRSALTALMSAARLEAIGVAGSSDSSWAMRRHGRLRRFGSARRVKARSRSSSHDVSHLPAAVGQALPNRGIELLSGLDRLRP